MPHCDERDGVRRRASSCSNGHIERKAAASSATSFESVVCTNLITSWLSAPEDSKRYIPPENYVALFQKDGGFIQSERAIVAASILALGTGATIRERGVR